PPAPSALSLHAALPISLVGGERLSETRDEAVELPVDPGPRAPGRPRRGPRGGRGGGARRAGGGHPRPRRGDPRRLLDQHPEASRSEEHTSELQSRENLV